MLATACDSSDSPLFSVTETDVRSLVEKLAADELAGRDNQTPGSELAQTFLVDELEEFSQPAFPAASGDTKYLQRYELGTNIVAIVACGELADE